ncbi:hypothetical protein CI088_00295 [Enterococcus plantarum]|uniref:Uncharacterized protein n=1 Tax=Enterococcus plantarum TaxID=1077675 RepID=A0A2W3ZVK0_9ENTE|nr:hypothetical protein [Enterococcus plantarum]PZL78244.1 hypothetical protein CI088_00295 [Enterococcus plantarum]
MLVHNTGNFIRHIGDVRLLPGANELNTAQAEQFKTDMKNPLNAVLEKSGEIKILEPKKNGEDDKGGFIGLNANDAITAINDTVDLALLEKWLAEENGNKKRATVIKAIENQIEDIKNPPVDDIVDPED